MRDALYRKDRVLFVVITTVELEGSGAHGVIHCIIVPSYCRAAKVGSRTLHSLCHADE